MNKIKETDIQSAILDFLSYNKIFAWRNNNTPVYDPTRKAFRAMPKGSIKGVADILGILSDGRMLAIEVKRPKCYASKVQKEFLTNINNNEGVGFVAKSVDDVRNVLNI